MPEKGPTRAWGRGLLNEAQKAWNDRMDKKWGSFVTGEQSDPEHRLIHGENASFGLLLAEPPGPAEQGEGWVMDEPERFGRLSRRLWDRLLTAEKLEVR